MMPILWNLTLRKTLIDISQFLQLNVWHVDCQLLSKQLLFLYFFFRLIDFRCNFKVNVEQQNLFLKYYNQTQSLFISCLQRWNIIINAILLGFFIQNPADTRIQFKITGFPRIFQLSSSPPPRSSILKFIFKVVDQKIEI